MKRRCFLLVLLISLCFLMGCAGPKEHVKVWHRTNLSQEEYDSLKADRMKNGFKVLIINPHVDRTYIIMPPAGFIKRSFLKSLVSEDQFQIGPQDQLELRVNSSSQQPGYVSNPRPWSISYRGWDVYGNFLGQKFQSWLIDNNPQTPREEPLPTELKGKYDAVWIIDYDPRRHPYWP